MPLEFQVKILICLRVIIKNVDGENFYINSIHKLKQELS